VSDAAVGGKRAAEARHVALEGEFAALDTGDARLDRRGVSVLAALARAPGVSYAQANETWSATKAAYRFVNHESVTREGLLSAHHARLEERCRDEDEVLLIGDTTEMTFNSRKKTEGLGVLSVEGSRGVYAHVGYCVTPAGKPLGVADVQFLRRSPETLGRRRHGAYQRVPLAERESRKWLWTLDTADELRRRIGIGPRLVVVCDREGDIDRVLSRAGAATENYFLIVRAVQKRSLAQVEPRTLVWDHLDSLAPQGSYAVEIPASSTRKARRATLEIRFTEITLNPSRVRAPDAPATSSPTRVVAILARETGQPEGEDPIVWCLYTTLPTRSLREAQACLERYASRWNIEVLFRTLKTVVRAESRQFRDVKTLEKAITIDLIVAFLVLRVTALTRDDPEQPCTVVFADDEWRSLWEYHSTERVPERPPPLGVMVRYLARLGGHLGRKGDGPPGAISLGRALLIFPVIVRAWRAFR
jgi:hypothetical protein